VKCVTTKAWLEGHNFDLEDLADLLAEGDVRVVHDADENAYYLSAPEIDKPPEAKRFDIAAKQLIDRINGLGRTKNSDFRLVRLAGRYTDPTGTHIHVGAAAGEFRFRGHAAGVAVGANGQPTPNPPSPWPDRFALADMNSDVADALEIMGQPKPLEWVDLRKVFEIIREEIKPDTVVGLGWSTNSELRSFLESAAHPAVSGRDALHARRREQPQHRKMSLAEARSYVSDLVTKWLGKLAGNP
jgi:hypothetical protein